MSSVRLPAAVVLRAAINFQCQRDSRIAERRMGLLEHAMAPRRRWSWRRLRFVTVQRTHDEALAYLMSDPEGWGSSWDHAARRGPRARQAEDLQRLAEAAMRNGIPTVLVDDEHIWLIDEYEQ